MQAITFDTPLLPIILQLLMFFNDIMLSKFTSSHMWSEILVGLALWKDFSDFLID